MFDLSESKLILLNVGDPTAQSAVHKWGQEITTPLIIHHNPQQLDYQITEDKSDVLAKISGVEFKSQEMILPGMVMISIIPWIFKPNFFKYLLSLKVFSEALKVGLAAKVEESCVIEPNIMLEIPEGWSRHGIKKPDPYFGPPTGEFFFSLDGMQHDVILQTLQTYVRL